MLEDLDDEALMSSDNPADLVLYAAKRSIEGKLEGRLEVARNLLVHGVSPDIIAESTGLSPEKIRELMN
ncbi:MAG: hypothetical protein LBK91_04820 [Synergistaceae bacterium]|nr:hypothetical protein [Synergistaceae bacterium]